MLLLLDDTTPGADISFNGPMLAMPYSLQRLGFTYVRNSLKTVYQGGSLVTLAANQFGTTYDAVTGLHAFEAEPAATNLALNSILAGGGAAPTSWTQTVATGTSAPAASIYGTASGAIAYLQTATAQRPFFAQTCSVSANTTYTHSFLIESHSVGLTAADIIGAASIPVGATAAYPVCEGNPAGGSSGAVTVGALRLTITVAGTAGTAIVRCGLGANVAATGTLQFSRPQFETGVRRTSWIATTTGTVTRAADVLSCAVANIPGFSASGYTLVVDGRRDVAVGVNGDAIAVTDGTSDNRSLIRLTSGAGNTCQTLTSSGAVIVASVNEGTPAVARLKAAYSCAADSFLRALSGVAGTADTGGAMPISPTTLYVGNSNGGTIFNGFIYGFKLIPVALNQAQTTGLTV